MQLHISLISHSTAAPSTISSRQGLTSSYQIRLCRMDSYVDGQLVTARGSRDGWQWMREYIKLLKQGNR